MREKIVAVVGGAGFIGSNLVRKLLETGCKKPIIIDNFSLQRFCGSQHGYFLLKDLPRSRLRLVREDASNFQAMRELLNGVDIVFNLAVLPLPLALKRPKYVFEKNIKIATTLGELLRKDIFKVLVHFSSSEVYGSAMYVPMDEKHPLSPSTAYGASKAAQDLLLLSCYETYGTDVRIIRPFNNVGMAQNDESYSAVIPRTIKRILSGKRPVVYGDGLQTRDFIYVEDTCDAAVRMAINKELKGEVINVASGKEVKIKDLVQKICSLMDYKGGILYRPPRPGDIRRHYANIDKAKKLLNFMPAVSLDEALKRTIDFYRRIYHA